MLATLSLITRKNSRHPLLLVGLVALGIMFLSWRIMPQTIAERALDALAGARDRREHAGRARRPRRSPAAASTSGSPPSTVIVAFGLTIVVKRASQPYVVESERRRLDACDD